jgi:hypothetical protein
MNEMPTMQEMRRLNAEDKLEGPQKQYFEPTKPVEELYDTATDPHEIKNLAGDLKYKDVLRRMRVIHAKWVRETPDMGLIPEPEFDEMKRPGGKYEKTAEPVFWAPKWQPGESTRRVTISCPTPGSSIVYRISGNGQAASAWRLYTKSVWLTKGKVLHAKACRIGFKDSGEVRFRFDDKASGSKPSKTPARDNQHWRHKLDQTDLLKRLRDIKELDGSGENGQYVKALKDKYASVRYWAVIGLHYNSKAEDIDKAKTACEKALDDPAAVVRIAAAHALCHWGSEDKALPVLAEALNDKTDKARLFAIIALNKIGEKARPLLSQIKAAEKDSDNYVQRVAKTTLEQLENK